MLSIDDMTAAAAAGDMEALRCSLQHHQEGVDATSEELLTFRIDGDYCACCHRHDWCVDCPLCVDYKCCGGLCGNASERLVLFEMHPNRWYRWRYRRAAKKLVAFIQGVIDAQES